MRVKQTQFLKLVIIGLGFFLLSPMVSRASTLDFSPTTGSFSIGGTFDVVVTLNTEGEYINAIKADISFPADKLQLVSPNIGSSVITVWASQPKFSNLSGTISFEGAIPGGLNSSNATVARLTFRVKQTGSAILRYTDGSRVILNDGLGTNSLTSSKNALFALTLPPPAGPVVVSETHANQDLWYNISNVILAWDNDYPTDAYSYVLNQEPIGLPDDISEGDNRSVIYRDLIDGKYYFHIKARRSGVWGGTTHFAINIDKTPPAQFPLRVFPKVRVASTTSVVTFTTSDNLSGLNYYELNIIPLSNVSGGGSNVRLFVEAESPYLVENLERGAYDVMVRAYDNAGNVREVTNRLSIVNSLFDYDGVGGLVFFGSLRINIYLFWLLLVLIIGILAFFATVIRREYQRVCEVRDNKLPSGLTEKLEELKKYRKKYGKTAILLLFVIAGSLFSTTSVLAAEGLGTPKIGLVSEQISNTDIFYVGGQIDRPATEVVVYWQNDATGENFSSTVVSDEAGRWFYRHNTFLPAGDYTIWTQTRENETLSPPSASSKIHVSKQAIQFGSSRLTTETLYLALLLVGLLTILVLTIVIISHARALRFARQRLNKEVKEAELAVTQGFAFLRRDIKNELAMLKNNKGSLTVAKDDLLRDLDQIEQLIGMEIRDVEELDITR